MGTLRILTDFRLLSAVWKDILRQGVVSIRFGKEVEV